MALILLLCLQSLLVFGFTDFDGRQLRRPGRPPKNSYLSPVKRQVRSRLQGMKKEVVSFTIFFPASSSLLCGCVIAVDEGYSECSVKDVSLDKKVRSKERRTWDDCSGW